MKLFISVFLAANFIAPLHAEISIYTGSMLLADVEAHLISAVQVDALDAQRTIRSRLTHSETISALAAKLPELETARRLPICWYHTRDSEVAPEASFARLQSELIGLTDKFGEKVAATHTGLESTRYTHEVVNDVKLPVLISTQRQFLRNNGPATHLKVYLLSQPESVSSSIMLRRIIGRQGEDRNAIEVFKMISAGRDVGSVRLNIAGMEVLLRPGFWTRHLQDLSLHIIRAIPRLIRS